MTSTAKCNNACGGGCCHEPQIITPKHERGLTIALAGQPNTGKSTLFNRLTGANQHVGNWPGKTVEKKEGTFKIGETTAHIYDLPGTYSLTASSVEERIARDFILTQAPDAVVIVVDAVQLERSLYMAAEMALFGVPTILAINKTDLLKHSDSIDIRTIEELSGMRAVAISARSRDGLDALSSLLEQMASEKRPVPISPLIGFLEARYGSRFTGLAHQIAINTPEGSPAHWTALKLLEGDEEVIKKSAPLLSQEAMEACAQTEDAIHSGAMARYDWIHGILKACGRTEEPPDINQGWFDRLATHWLWGIPVALLMLVVSMVGAYLVAIPLMIPGFALFFSCGIIRDKLATFAPEWVAAMVGQGLGCGLSAGCIMIGFIGGVFFIMGILENSGYLARLSYIFDPFMKRLGLHGKSVMPMLMGLMCNIMGVAGSRTVDSWRQRMATLVMVPIVPCKALLVVIAFISGIFFGSKAIAIMLALFGVMIVHLFVTSKLLNRFVLPGETTGLLMELPPYQKPDFKSVCLYSFTHMKSFYKRGFWFVAIFSFFTWVGVYFPGGTINDSFLASAGKFLEPAGRLMGFDWRLCIIFVIAFLSKEATLSAMVLIFGMATTSNTDLMGIAADPEILRAIGDGLHTTLAQSGLHPAGALAFVFAIFFSLPCFSTLGMIYAETHSSRWTLGALAYYFVVSITMGMLAYRAGLLLFA